MPDTPTDPDVPLTLRIVRLMLPVGMLLVWLVRGTTDPDYWPSGGWQWLAWAVVVFFVFCAVVSGIDLARALSGRFHPSHGRNRHEPSD